MEPAGGIARLVRAVTGQAASNVPNRRARLSGTVLDRCARFAFTPVTHAKAPRAARRRSPILARSRRRGAQAGVGWL
jgi:hypothetical protein